MQTVGHCTGLKRAGGSPRICRCVGKRLRGVILLSRERRTAPRGPGRRTQYRGRHGSVSVTMETPFGACVGMVRRWSRLWMSEKAEGVFIVRHLRAFDRKTTKALPLENLRTDWSCTKFAVAKMSAASAKEVKFDMSDGTQNIVTNVKL